MMLYPAFAIFQLALILSTPHHPGAEQPGPPFFSTLALGGEAYSSLTPVLAETTEPGTDVTFAGAGDIATNGAEDEETASLLEEVLLEDPDAVIFTLGDNAYPEGSASDYFNFYEPSWGRFKSRTRPVPGNHEYRSPGAAPYYHYFGAQAGPRGKGYYSYDVGSWHIVALNSEIDIARGSEQETWLRSDLAAHRTTCILAYWHTPRFSSGQNGSSIHVQPFWEALYEAGADIILAGHDHHYERFAPQDPDGVVDAVQGIRQFVVGTGGVSLYPFREPLPNSEIRDNATYGILKLTLGPGRYAWEFLPVSGRTFTDSGMGACSATRPPPPDFTFETRVSSGADDVEEEIGADTTYLDSTGIDLVYDGDVEQIVGIRFRDVSIPRGAVIKDAYIQFTARDAGSSGASLIIQGDFSDNSPTFDAEAQSISKRALTEAKVVWNPPPWSFEGESTLKQRTPSLREVIQEIVTRRGWVSGNALSIIVRGSGQRTARSSEYEEADAPILHVEYSYP